MPTKTVAVGSSVGLHARPAQIISEAVGELDAEVMLGVPGDEPVDASSSLLIMTLGAAAATWSRSPATTRPPSTRSPPWSRRTSTPERVRVSGSRSRQLPGESPSRRQFLHTGNGHPAAPPGAGPHGRRASPGSGRCDQCRGPERGPPEASAALSQAAAASGRNATRSSSCQYVAASRVLARARPPLVDVRRWRNGDAAAVDAVQAGEVRRRSARRRGRPDRSTVSTQSTTPVTPGRPCQQHVGRVEVAVQERRSSYGGAGSAEPANASPVEPVDHGTRAAPVPLGLEGPATRSAAADWPRRPVRDARGSRSSTCRPAAVEVPVASTRSSAPRQPGHQQARGRRSVRSPADVEPRACGGAGTRSRARSRCTLALAGEQRLGVPAPGVVDELAGAPPRRPSSTPEQQHPVRPRPPHETGPRRDDARARGTSSDPATQRRREPRSCCAGRGRRRARRRPARARASRCRRTARGRSRRSRSTPSGRARRTPRGTSRPAPAPGDGLNVRLSVCQAPSRCRS